MKKAIFYITVITILAVSCKKDTPARIPLSQWTYAGVSYKGFAKTYPLSYEFSATENLNAIGAATGNFAAIHFSYGYMPSKSGTYKVKENPADNTECRLTVGVIGNPTSDYTSVDSTFEVVITVSPTGKLTASFSGVVLSDYNRTETRTVSGTLVEE